MNQPNNPFISDYSNLTVQRLLVISSEGDDALVYRPIHPSQSHFKDDGKIAGQWCIFCDDFALLRNAPAL